MNRLKRKIGGFTITEMMISLSILGVITAGTAVYLADLDKTRYRMEAMSTRDALTLRLKRLTTISIVAWSASNFATDEQGNAELLKCIEGVGGPCTVTNATQPRSFILGYPVQQTNAKVQIAGTEAKPIEYCHDGGPVSDTKKCRPEWRATAYFSAICPFGAASCAKASAVRISHRIENTSLKDEKFFTKDQKKIAGLGLRSGDNGVFTTLEIPQDLRRTANACNPDSAISKVLQNGAVTCQCLPGAKQINGAMLNGQPVCTPEDVKCDPPKVATGYSIDDAGKLQKVCKDGHNVDSIPMQQTCGGYTNGLNLGGCTYIDLSGKKKSKGGGGTQVSCAAATQTCVTPR